MKQQKTIKKKPFTGIRSIDTITTKLLTLVLFITLIPLMAVANFSTDIINQSMIDSLNKELEYNAKFVSDKYTESLEKLQNLNNQKLKNVLINLYKNFAKTKNSFVFNQHLKKFKKDYNLDFCFFIDKKNYVMAEKQPKEFLKLIEEGFNGKTIVSTENLLQEKEFVLSQIVVMPVNFPNNKAVFVFGKYINKNNSLIYPIINISGIEIDFFQINNGKIKNIFKPVNFNQENNINIGETLAYIQSGGPSIIKKEKSGDFEIGKYVPIKNYFGNITGAIYVGIKSNNIFEPVKKNIKLMSLISVISLIVAIVLAALFARTITTPILKLVIAAKSIADGDLDQKVQIKGNDEIAELSDAFNKMTYNLKKQEQLRDNFVATLTHDLKVPMLAENQTISYLLDEVYGPITKEQKEVLELIKSTNSSSMEMVSTLLEVYRFDTGNVQLLKKEENIVQIVNDSINQINSLALEKNIKISLETEFKNIPVEIDEREIKRVLHNIISNAINNGVEGGYVKCIINKTGKNKIFMEQKNKNFVTTLKKPLDISNSVLISIEDNGVGISAEDIPQLFKRFSLSKGRKPAGTGLGLYYSYQVISRHNGHIWAESIEGKGSKFYFTLPLTEGI